MIAVMDRTTKLKIISNHLASLGGDEFQSVCNRLGETLYPNDFTPVRAGGPQGDMSNDGYCPKARVFLAAHATRGEEIASTKRKIKSDLEGCIKKHSSVKEWIYLTNDTLVGEIHTYVDEELRPKYPNVDIRTMDNNSVFTV